MPELLTICRSCGREWTPDHTDYVRNTWRICPDCRDGPKGKDAKTMVSTLYGPGNDPQGHIDEISTLREGKPS